MTSTIRLFVFMCALSLFVFTAAMAILVPAFLAGYGVGFMLTLLGGL